MPRGAVCLNVSKDCKLTFFLHALARVCSPLAAAANAAVRGRQPPEATTRSGGGEAPAATGTYGCPRDNYDAPRRTELVSTNHGTNGRGIGEIERTRGVLPA